MIGNKVVYCGRNFETRDVFDLAWWRPPSPRIAAVLAGLTFGHLDDLDAV